MIKNNIHPWSFFNKNPQRVTSGIFVSGCFLNQFLFLNDMKRATTIAYMIKTNTVTHFLSVIAFY